jgi:hypothetical protein
LKETAKVHSFFFENEADITTQTTTYCTIPFLYTQYICVTHVQFDFFSHMTKI